jgi:hypothetical protein
MARKRIPSNIENTYTSIYIQEVVYAKAKMKFIEDDLTLKLFVNTCLNLYNKNHSEFFNMIQNEISSSSNLE